LLLLLNDLSLDDPAARIATPVPRADAAMSAPAFDAFRDAFVAGDAGQLAETFTSTGAYATNNGFLLQGRDQIRMGAAQWFSRRPPGAVVELEVRLVRSDGTDQLRWELLEYHQHGSVPGQPAAGTIDEAEHALTVYHRSDDGTWHIESLVVNLRPPMPG
jgi:uncharacterized protein (TIGR02246 family)